MREGDAPGNRQCIQRAIGRAKLYTEHPNDQM